MGLGVLPRTVWDEARARARNGQDGTWAVLARDVEDRAARLRTSNRRWSVLLVVTALVVARTSGEAISAWVDGRLPSTPVLLVLTAGAVLVAVVRLVEQLRIRERLIALLWDALVLTCVKPSSTPYRVEAEVAGRLAYAACLARTRLAASAGFSAYGRARAPRRKARVLAERLRTCSEWPFRFAGTQAHGRDWRADLQAELPQWIRALDENTWYRRIRDDVREPFDDLPDVRLAGLAALGILGAGAVVLDAEHVVDGSAATTVTAAVVLVAVGRPVACCVEAALVAVRARLPRVLD